HYFVHGGFFPTESYLLDNVDRVRHIPCVIIQVGGAGGSALVRQFWAVRRGVPGQERLGPAPRLARGALRPRAGRGAQRRGARKHQRVDASYRDVQSQQQTRRRKC
ncbi:unnamed protein product, partial [Heterosigma akashiwo]